MTRNILTMTMVPGDLGLLSGFVQQLRNCLGKVLHTLFITHGAVFSALAFAGSVLTCSSHSLSNEIITRGSHLHDLVVSENLNPQHPFITFIRLLVKFIAQ